MNVMMIKKFNTVLIVITCISYNCCLYIYTCLITIWYI